MCLVFGLHPNFNLHKTLVSPSAKSIRYSGISITPKGAMPRRHEDPDWVWRGHPNHRSPPGNGNADVNNPLNNITCPSVTYPAALAFRPRA
jgi:hypothetical protein